MMDNSDSKSSPDANFNQSGISTSNISYVFERAEEEEILDLIDVLVESPEEKSEEPVDSAAYAQKVDDPPIAAISHEIDSENDPGPVQMDALDKGVEQAAEADIAGISDMTVADRPMSVSEFPVETQLESAITSEMLENALERVIARMFSEKIEPLLVEAVERGVQKEIERLRALLLEDVPDARKL